MMDIPLDLAIQYLSNLSSEQIEITDHFIKRREQREILDEWILDCLMNKDRLGILKQSANKFRLYYEHPENPKEFDIIIIVAIDDTTQHITIITTYNQNIEQRVR